MAWIEKKQRTRRRRLRSRRLAARRSAAMAPTSPRRSALGPTRRTSRGPTASRRWSTPRGSGGQMAGSGARASSGPSATDPLTAPPRFIDIGEEYVRQIVDLSPGQRKRYLGHLKVLGSTRVRGSLLFTKPVTAITEADLKDWLIDWDRSLKTKANYHGLIHGVFAYAVKRGYLTANPAVGTAPRSRGSGSHGRSCASSPRRELRGRRPAGRPATATCSGLRSGPGCGSASSARSGSATSTSTGARSGSTRRGSETARTTPPRSPAGWQATRGQAHRCATTTSGFPKTPKSRRTITISAAVAAALDAGTRAERPTTSSSPAAPACRCTTATSTPTSGAS